MKLLLRAALFVTVLIACVSAKKGGAQAKPEQQDKKAGSKSANLKDRNEEVEKLLKQLHDPKTRKAFEDWIEKNGLTEDTLKKLRSETEGDDSNDEKSDDKDSKDDYEKTENKGSKKK